MPRHLKAMHDHSQAERQQLANKSIMNVDLNFLFRKSQRDRFRSGELVSEWRGRYPHLFDEDDARVLRTDHQRRYNFYEWLAAVLIFESTGYLSLVAKYTAKSHLAKHAPLRSVIPTAIADWVFANESGQPDLFVYSASAKDWFFCEVKGPGDRIRDNQKKWRTGLEKALVEQKVEPLNRYRVFRLEEIDEPPRES